LESFETALAQARDLIERGRFADASESHGAVAIADAYPALGQMQLESTDILGRGRVGRALQKCSEPLAGRPLFQDDLSGVVVIKPLFHGQRAHAASWHCDEFLADETIIVASL
jgi:hypothetical protein